MRFFLAGLLIVNIAFAAWYWLIRQSGEILLPDPVTGVEKLVLVSERQHATNLLKQAEEVTSQSAELQDEPEELQPAIRPPVKQPKPVKPEPKKTTQQVTGKPGKQYCYATSKFKSRLVATDVSADLQALGYQASVATLYSIKPKYLVYLSSYPSLNAARKVTDHLQASGDRDFQILTINGQKNSISLGVYSQADTADIRIKEIAALGYTPLVEPVYGKVSGYRVEFSKQDQTLINEQDKVQLFKSYRKGAIESIKCGS